MSALTEYLNSTTPRMRDMLMHRADNTRAVSVRLSHMKMVDGNATDGLLLSQIFYWYDLRFDPETRSMQPPRVQYKRDGRYWVVRTLEQWSMDTGLKYGTLRESFKRLENMGLIVRRRMLMPLYNKQMTGTSLNWDAYESALDQENNE